MSFTGDPKDRIGYAILWCDTCHEGIALDRLRVPPGVDMLSFDASEEEQDAVVPRDVRLLPPDPVLGEGEEAEF